MDSIIVSSTTVEGQRGGVFTVQTMGELQREFSRVFVVKTLDEVDAATGEKVVQIASHLEDEVFKTVVGKWVVDGQTFSDSVALTNALEDIVWEAIKIAGDEVTGATVNGDEVPKEGNILRFENIAEAADIEALEQKISTNKQLIDQTTSAINANKQSINAINQSIDDIDVEVDVVKNQVAINTSDIEGIQQSLSEKEHFRGYYATTSHIQSIANATQGDFAYNAQTGTKWTYNGAAWEDTGVAVPDQMVPKSAAIPLMDGIAAVGTEEAYAAGDHRHPTDATRASQVDMEAAQSGIADMQTELSVLQANAVQSATLGEAAVVKSGSRLQFPAYPTALANPHILELQLNGTAQILYDGGAAKTFNVTPSAIAAATAAQGALADTAVQGATLGGTAVAVNDKILQLPAYPVSLANPNALTLQLNGTALPAYNGSAARTWNITPASIGAALVAHSHTASQVTGLASVATSGDYNELINKPDLTSYLPLTGGTLTGSLTAVGNVAANGFIKKDSSNSYALLGGGGHAAVSTLNVNGAKVVTDRLSYAGFVASYQAATTTAQGILIRLPHTITSGKMLQFTVKCYRNYAIHNIVFSCYLYNTSGGIMHEPKAIMEVGSSPVPVKMGKATSNDAYVWIGGLSDYAGVVITDVVVGGYSGGGDFSNGWAITQSATGAEIATVALDTTIYPAVTSNGSNATGTWPISIAGNADTVDGQHFIYSNIDDQPKFLWGTNEYGQSFLAARSYLKVLGLNTIRTIFGQPFDGTQNVSGNMTDVGSITMYNGSSLVGVGGIEMYYKTPYIDFHYNNDSSKDYTSRIIENAAGRINIIANTDITGSVSVSKTLQTRYFGGSWLSMATRPEQILGDRQNSSESAHSLFTLKNSNGDAISYGGLGVNIGFYGFTAERIAAGDNGTNWHTIWNVNTGEISHAARLFVDGVIRGTSWFTSIGATGWSNETYGGGIYMQDTTYIRTYGYKRFHVGNADDAVHGDGYDSAISTFGGISAAQTIWAGGNVYANGAITALATGTSDKRLKAAVKDFSGLLLMKKIGKAFAHEWNDEALSLNPQLSNRYVNHSWSAQKVEEILPQYVLHNLYGKDYLGINREGLLPLVWNGVLEVNDELGKLKKRVKELEQEVKRLKAA